MAVPVLAVIVDDNNTGFLQCEIFSLVNPPLWGIDWNDDVSILMGKIAFHLLTFSI